MSTQFKRITEVSSTTDSLSAGSLNDPICFKDLLHTPEHSKDCFIPGSFKKHPKNEENYLTFGTTRSYCDTDHQTPEVKINKFLNSKQTTKLIDQENLPNLPNLSSSRLLDLEQTTQQQQAQESQKPKKSKVRKSQLLGDRFIPQRKSSNFPQYNNSKKRLDNVDISSNQTAIDMLYKAQILQQPNYIEEENENYQLKYVNKNLLKFNNPLCYLDQLHPNNKNSPLVDSQYFAVPEDICQSYNKYVRNIAKIPFKVLDAPALQDDFYLNLIDWSNQNILSVALSQCVYLWSAQSSKVTKLLDLGQSDQVTSVAWSLQGPIISVGTNSGEVQIWDTVKVKKIRTMKGHLSRVGTLCFSQNLLSSGSRDKQILQRDLRSPSQFLWKQSAHKQEVCGLKWSPDSQLLASGGNDNKLYLWSSHNSTTPVCKFSEHQAAVKAIAWSPHQHGLLASGGGTADRTIRFWNALEGKHLSKEDTGSQVCNLLFSKRENEIISTHGYSQNQIVLWKCKGMKRVATLTGHTYRVLYLAMSPDGYTIVTGAGDETLRFWNIYPSNSQDDVQETPKESDLSYNSFSLR